MHFMGKRTYITRSAIATDILMLEKSRVTLDRLAKVTLFTKGRSAQ